MSGLGAIEILAREIEALRSDNEMLRWRVDSLTERLATVLSEATEAGADVPSLAEILETVGHAITNWVESGAIPRASSDPARAEHLRSEVSAMIEDRDGMLEPTTRLVRGLEADLGRTPTFPVVQTHEGGTASEATRREAGLSPLPASLHVSRMTEGVRHPGPPPGVPTTAPPTAPSPTTEPTAPTEASPAGAESRETARNRSDPDPFYAPPPVAHPHSALSNPVPPYPHAPPPVWAGGYGPALGWTPASPGWYSPAPTHPPHGTPYTPYPYAVAPTFAYGPAYPHGAPTHPGWGYPVVGPMPAHPYGPPPMPPAAPPLPTGWSWTPVAPYPVAPRPDENDPDR